MKRRKREYKWGVDDTVQTVILLVILGFALLMAIFGGRA